MIEFRLESWMAVAPRLSTEKEWFEWSSNPQIIDESKINGDLSSIPAMLRRRFSVLGKSALFSTLPLLQKDERIPSVFASRHGDTALTLSLLESIGKDQDLSPTKFSLAVHNAVSGLFSIARNDTSAVTSIAASQGLVIQAMIEASGLLMTEPRVLCVVHDIPLPQLYCEHTESLTFPYSIAFILNKSKGKRVRIDTLADSQNNLLSTAKGRLVTNELEFISLLVGVKDVMETNVKGVIWRTSMADN